MASSYVGKPCPKCGHVRAESEAAPEWQCPKCGIVYAKFGQKAPVAASAPAARDTAQRDAVTEEVVESTGLAKLAHVSTLGNLLLPPLGTIAPIAIWVMKSAEGGLAVESAKEALNFQISTLLWALALVLLMFLFPPLAYVTSFLLVALLIACIVMPIVATIRVSDGVRYYYPCTLHLFGEGPGPD